MKIPYSLIMLGASLLGIKYEAKTRPEKAFDAAFRESFYQFKMINMSGDTIDFHQFKGKKVLIVNTASECGYTPQFGKLQELHEKFGDKVTVLGFPCNQFGGQEPGNNAEIQQFCKKNFGVTFMMFQKLEVKGENKHPLYGWLTNKDMNGWNTQEPSWNFCKYLINENGELIKYYSSGVSPMSSEVLDAIKN